MFFFLRLIFVTKTSQSSDYWVKKHTLSLFLFIYAIRFRRITIIMRSICYYNYNHG